MKRSIRLIGFLCASLLSLSTLAGCVHEPDDSTQTSSPTGTTAESTAETLTETLSEEARMDALLEELKEAADWGDRELGILYANNISGYAEEVEAKKTADDSTASGVINDAVYQRNTLFEEYCDLTFVRIPSDNGSITGKLTAEVKTGSGDFFFVANTTDSTASAACSGLLQNYLDLNIDYENVWWDKGTLDFAINGKVFFMNGPFNIVDDDVTYIMMFNKQLRKDNKIDDLYAAVKENTWTLDYFHSIITPLSKENGDGKWDVADSYGFATPGNIGTTFFYGAGLRYLRNDRTMKRPELVLTETQMERAQNVLESTCAILYNGHSTYVPPADALDSAMDLFVEGRALFYSEAASYLRYINADMDAEYGVLPIPKYTASQEQYTTWSHSIGSTLSMPTSVMQHTTAEQLSRVLETYAVLSEKHVRPAYYDNLLTVRNLRDSESAEMMDLIFQNRIYDMAMYFSDLGLSDLFDKNVQPSGGAFASSYAGVVSKFDMRMDRVFGDLFDD